MRYQWPAVSVSHTARLVASHVVIPEKPALKAPAKRVKPNGWESHVTRAVQVFEWPAIATLRLCSGQARYGPRNDKRLDPEPPPVSFEAFFAAHA